jgi:hypothetical protein
MQYSKKYYSTDWNIVQFQRKKFSLFAKPSISIGIPLFLYHKREQGKGTVSLFDGEKKPEKRRKG